MLDNVKINYTINTTIYLNNKKSYNYWFGTSFGLVLLLFGISIFMCGSILSINVSIASRAGYRSKIFDIDTDTDTLTSIQIPEWYLFRYQFYKICFNKITLPQKISGFIF